MDRLLNEIREWRDRLLTRESVLLIIVLWAVLSGRVDTMEEGIALAGPISAFIFGAQYRKARGTGPNSPHHGRSINPH